MELHEQLASPELCNQLHKLGVTAPSVFWRDWTGSKSDELEWAENFEPYFCEDNVNAYSATELGEMLPNTEYCLSRREPNGKEWRCGNQIESTEADARAKMLIYLLENKLIGDLRVEPRAQ